MKMSVQPVLTALLVILLAAALSGCAGSGDKAVAPPPPPPAAPYPPTAKVPVVNDYHGTKITDTYRWLEDAGKEEVQAWTDVQEAYTNSHIGDLPQQTWVEGRYNALWRYDDESVPRRVLEGDRLFYWTKKKEDEKWVYVTKANEDAEARVLIDPNTWDPNNTLAGVNPSRDGKYVAFGTAHGGDENPVIQVMVTETGEILPDKLRGWKQSISAWLPGNVGFYYTCKPLEDEVPEGEHEYWHSVWYHELGTDPGQDEKIFWDDDVKETWHGVWLTEDAEYTVYYRGLFNVNDLWFKRTGTDDELTPIAEGMSNEYGVDIVDGKMLITTDKDAPRRMVYITDVDKPAPENWRVFLAEDPKDNLSYIAAINGYIYATYSHNTYTVTKIYDLAGNYLRDLPYPTIGTGGVSGRWSMDDVWVYFSSFTYPPTTFKYDFAADALAVYHEFPVEVNVDHVVAEQVWYKSKDGTPVSMFVVHDKNLEKDGNNPALLTGYGGFDVSMRPDFSTEALVWLEAGGVYAVANLRGGGEYGREWHEGGMREKKQNVFDDFIAAAEYLIDQGYTSSERLGISGGSNGGLLVGAATVQRPELFRAVLCAVPLLDMVTYHQHGVANIWSEEYGSSDDPEQFEYLHAYSPYHNIAPGLAYPAFLVTGSENDARVDPLHARKMCAALQEADQGGGPIMLLINRDSGHGGGTTLSKQIAQRAKLRAYLMDQLGMDAP